MNPDRRDAPPGVPTLTEVLAMPEPGREAAPVRDGAPASVSAQPSPDPDALTERILADVQAQVDQLLEQRLREVLAPILARASDAVVREARGELSRSLREIVSRSVARELLRQRTR